MRILSIIVAMTENPLEVQRANMEQKNHELGKTSTFHLALCVLPLRTLAACAYMLLHHPS
jgi:hypothetical protein